MPLNHGGGAGNRILVRATIQSSSQASEFVRDADAFDSSGAEGVSPSGSTSEPCEVKPNGTNTVRSPSAVPSRSAQTPWSNRRASGVPTLAWLFAQTVQEPCALVAGDCFVWQRTKTSDGYGSVCIDGRSVVAHRVAYELSKGPVACWLTIDHLCRNRPCINPAHHEPVTQAENTRRGMAPTAIAHRTGLCPRGHTLVPEGGRMRCKVCQSQRQREWYQRQKPSRGEAGQ